MPSWHGAHLKAQGELYLLPLMNIPFRKGIGHALSGDRWKFDSSFTFKIRYLCFK
jgi:hypothetical protein